MSRPWPDLALRARVARVRAVAAEYRVFDEMMHQVAEEATRMLRQLSPPDPDVTKEVARIAAGMIRAKRGDLS